MACSKTRIIIGGLAHVPVLIFMANFIKGNFGIKTQEVKDNVLNEEPVKIVEVKETILKERKAKLSRSFQTSLKVLNKRLMRFMER